jgi:predicted pyridoxine 5'-phosphate oxidase superfamily flavin-nucleotide-binding protein
MFSVKVSRLSQLNAENVNAEAPRRYVVLVTPTFADLAKAQYILLATCAMNGRPTSEAVEGTAAILDKSQTAAVYDAIGKRYGVVGKVFNFFSKLRGGMDNNVGLELKVA